MPCEHDIHEVSTVSPNEATCAPPKHAVEERDTQERGGQRVGAMEYSGGEGPCEVEHACPEKNGDAMGSLGSQDSSITSNRVAVSCARVMKC